MFRHIFTTKSSLSLSIQHSRSLTRYSESYLHVHDPQSVNTSSINYSLLIIIYLLSFSNCYMITSSIPLYYNYFQSSYGPIGISLLYSLFGFFTLLSQPFTSYLIDRKGPKIPLMYGTILIIITVIIFIVSFNFQSDKNHSYGLLILGQCFHGMASPLIQESGLSFLAMSYTNDIRLKIINIMTNISLLGYVLGPLLSGVCYSQVNALSVYLPPLILISISFFLYLTVYNGGHSIFVNEMTDEDAEIAIGLLPSSNIPSHNHYSQHDGTSSSSTHHHPHHHHNHNHLPPPHPHHSITSSSFYGKQRIENFYSFLHIFTNTFHFITFLSSVLSTLLLGIFFPLGPIYLHEQFHLTIFQQGLMISLLLITITLLSPLLCYFIDKSSSSSLNSYQYHENIHNTNQLTSLTQYQAIYIGLLFIGLTLCCIVWIVDIYVLVLVWLSLGIGFTILTIPLMRFFGEIAEWKGYEDHSTASLMYDMSTSLGFTIGPLIGSSLQLALGGGTSGFTRGCFILGIIYSLYSLSVLHLRSVGRRLGEDSLELEGSIYGRALLDGNDPSDHLFTSTTLQSTSPNTRNLFESSFRDNLMFSISRKGEEEESAVF